jgi:hypothetical protein
MFDLVRRARAYARREQNVTLPFWDWLSESRDAYASLIALKQDREFKYRIPVGYAGGGWLHTEPRTHLLGVGPSQGTGKTAGIVIPAVLMMGGPVLSVSSKFDVAENTALARSRLGDVWHFDPTGGPCPEGFKEVRWSPIPASIDWDIAGDIAEQMMMASDTESSGTSSPGSETAHHFRHRGADLLAPLLHFAALKGLDMADVAGLINAYKLSDELAPLHDALEVLGAKEAADVLWGVMMSEDRERSGIFSTVSVALRGYRGNALRVASDVNFDTESFVEGEPDALSNLFLEPSGEREETLARWSIYPRLRGRYPTLYITCPAELQKRYRPVIVGFLSAIRRAAYARHREAKAQGRYNLQPVTWVLDEIFQTGPHDLMELLSEAGGQGLQIVGSIQGIGQAIHRYGKAGEEFLTMFQTTCVLRGIKHRESMELLSILCGEYDRPMVSYGESFSGGTRQWSETRSTVRQRILAPDEITRGHPTDKRAMLTFTPDGSWRYVRQLPYYVGAPWPAILLQSAEWAMSGVFGGNRSLPFPDLARDGDYSALYATGGAEMVDWYNELHNEWERHRGTAIRGRVLPPA